MYDTDSQLLYVGITNNVDQRFTAHAATKSWWTDVDNINLKQYPDRESAILAERLAILSEYPRYNELVTSKPYAASPEKRYPTTHSKLPESEIAYLRSLDGADMLNRAAELQAAGWSVATILDGVRVAPTSVQLRVALKSIYNPNTGVPVPEPPKSKRIKREERLEKITHLTEEEISQLQYYSVLARKFRPQYPAAHPISAAAQTYRELINTHHANGVPIREMAEAVGCDEGNIRRRILK
jgi:hypothetical protein